VFENSDFITVLATMPSREQELFQNIKNSNAKIVYLNPIEDRAMLDICEIFSKYESGSEEGVLAILAKEILRDKSLSSNIKNFFEDLDEGYISAESNIAEEEIEDISALANSSKSPYIYVGDDIKNHPRVANIKKIVSLLCKFGGFKSNLKEVDIDDIEEVDELDSFDGSVVYFCKALNSDEEKHLFGSKQFMIATKLNNNQKIRVLADNKSFERVFKLDENLKGTIALLPGAESDSYSYKVAKIMKEDV
jgi:NADH-quinone oxidoreductase subunit F